MSCSKWWSDLSDCMLNITGESSTGKMLTPPTQDQGVKSREVSSTHGSIIMDTDILLRVTAHHVGWSVAGPPSCMIPARNNTQFAYHNVTTQILFNLRDANLISVQIPHCSQ